MSRRRPEARPLVGGHVSTAGGLHNATANARRIGAEVIQIFPSNPRQWRSYPYTGEELQDFARSLARHQLPLYVHTTYLLSLASPDESLRATSAQSLAEAYRFAARCGAAALITHVGSHHGEGTATVAPRVIETCLAARSLARALLQHDAAAQSEQATPEATMAAAPDTSPAHTALPDAVRRCRELPLLMETGAGSGNIIGSLADLQLLLALLDGCQVPCGICLDTAHLFAAGFPLHTAEGVETLLAYLQARGMLERVGAVHLNDCATPLGSRHDRHANLWEGHIGRTGLQAVLGHPALRDVPFILEVPGFDGHGPDRRNVLRARRMRRAALASS